METLRMILHPILWNTISKTYYTPNLTKLSKKGRKFTIGRGMIIFFRMIGILKHQANPNNINTSKPNISRLSNAQAVMLNNQLNKLPLYNRHRRLISQIYNHTLPQKHKISSTAHLYLRFPLQLKNPGKISSALKLRKIIPGNWYVSPVHPALDQLDRFAYKRHSCPNAERASTRSLNLPTHINTTEADAVRIARIVRKKVRSKK